MNWLNVKTEYSFGAVYGPVEQTVKILKKQGSEAAGICDINGTYGFIAWEKACKDAGIKPIFGVQLPVVCDLQEKDRRGPICEMLFIAVDNHGLRDIYRLTELAYKQMYYIPRLSAEQVSTLNPNGIIVISGVAPTLAMTWDIEIPLGTQFGPNLPYAVREVGSPVACIDNWYPKPKDQAIYEPFADNIKLERKTTPQWILSDQEYDEAMGNVKRAITARNRRDQIARLCCAKLQQAPLIKFPGKVWIEGKCLAGARKMGLDLKKKKYRKRLDYELDLIRSKGYVDYFMMVSDIIDWSKKNGILVGPGRGSAGGSLVAYCLGITTVDPIKYDLIFERFIDVNRSDLPDIDIDFPDTERQRVLNYISRTYGEENVSQISNINKLQAKSALNRVAKVFKVPMNEILPIKNVLIERTAGDFGYDDCLRDTFKTTEEGKALLKEHKNLKIATKMEGHALHTGVHAAGVLVSNEPISNYCGINSKDKRVAMIDMREAEYLNLLKIDALGLRTLSIIADVCKAKGIKQEDIYKLPDGDKKTYKMLNKGRYTGIFQLEGKAARGLASRMTMESIEDLAAISAVARPGPLQSGGAYHYVDRKNGKEKVSFTTNHKIFKKATKDTAGVIVYQEQVMRILKDLGNLSWKDVIYLRKQMAKTMGVEAFDKYGKKFIKGCIKNGLDRDEAQGVWETLVTFGKYGFNKSHSVAYAIISYWTAYLKAHFPMEFAVACLNNSKSDRDSILLLRDLGKYEGISYIWFDPKVSEAGWSFKDKTIYGGFTNIKGIAAAKAKQAVTLRSEGKEFPAGIQACIDRENSPLRWLYPARDVWKPIVLGQSAMPIVNIGEYAGHDMPGEIVKIIGNLIDLEITESKATSDLKINIRVEDDTEQIICFVKDPYLISDLDEVKKLEIEKEWLWLKGEFRQGKFAPYFIVSDFYAIKKED